MESYRIIESDPFQTTHAHADDKKVDDEKVIP